MVTYTQFQKKHQTKKTIENPKNHCSTYVKHKSLWENYIALNFKKTLQA